MTLIKLTAIIIIILTAISHSNLRLIGWLLTLIIYLLIRSLQLLLVFFKDEIKLRLLFLMKRPLPHRKQLFSERTTQKSNQVSLQFLKVHQKSLIQD